MGLVGLVGEAIQVKPISQPLMHLPMGAQGATTVQMVVRHANAQGTNRGDPTSGLQARQQQQRQSQKARKSARAQVGEGNQADLRGKSLELRDGKGMMVYLHGQRYGMVEIQLSIQDDSF